MVALFQSAAVRTSGFATIDFGRLGAFTLFACVALMLVGGASGSTTGGVKLATVGVVGTAILATLRGQEEPQLFGRRLATPLVFRAMTIIALLLLAHFAATLALAWTEDRWGRNPSFIAVMFEAMSALATDGHSTGITTTLSSPGKLVLCAAMILGKVGPLTAAYALQQR
jgi:trk system potassium uptake protein TrkH